mgnify:CR=1 FL=1
MYIMKQLHIILFFSIALFACENANTEAETNDRIDAVTDSIDTAVPEEGLVIIEENVEEEFEIPQGTFDFEIFQAEYGGRVDNLQSSVSISGDDIVVTVEDFPGTTGITTIYSGKIIKHISGKWILSNNPLDAEEQHIGGCTGISIIDFNRKLIEMC